MRRTWKTVKEYSIRECLEIAYDKVAVLLLTPRDRVTNGSAVRRTEKYPLKIFTNSLSIPALALR